MHDQLFKGVHYSVSSRPIQCRVGYQETFIRLGDGTQHSCMYIYTYIYKKAYEINSLLGGFIETLAIS